MSRTVALTALILTAALCRPAYAVPAHPESEPTLAEEIERELAVPLPTSRWTSPVRGIAVPLPEHWGLPRSVPAASSAARARTPEGEALYAFAIAITAAMAFAILGVMLVALWSRPGRASGRLSREAHRALALAALVGCGWLLSELFAYEPRAPRLARESCWENAAQAGCYRGLDDRRARRSAPWPEGLNVISLPEPAPLVLLGPLLLALPLLRHSRRR